MNQNIVKTYTYKGYGEVNIEAVTDDRQTVYYAYFEDGSPACDSFDHLPTRQEVFERIEL